MLYLAVIYRRPEGEAQCTLLEEPPRDLTKHGVIHYCHSFWKIHNWTATCIKNRAWPVVGPEGSKFQLTEPEMTALLLTIPQSSSWRSYSAPSSPRAWRGYQFFTDDELVPIPDFLRNRLL